jgi:hypothetical protein
MADKSEYIRFSSVEVHCALREEKPMASALNRNYTGHCRILELYNILKTDCTKVRAHGILIKYNSKVQSYYMENSKELFIALTSFVSLT